MAVMATRKATPVRFPDGLLEQIDSTLVYGQSRNAWIVEACQMRLDGRTSRRAKQPEPWDDGDRDISHLPGVTLPAPPPRAPGGRVPLSSFDPDEATPDA